MNMWTVGPEGGTGARGAAILCAPRPLKQDMTLIDLLRSELGERYTIERELGGGGMSVVFVAMERALERRVVIKVLSPELGQSVNLDRFKREIATLATLQHPQIVPIFSAGQAGEVLYYVMPFVAGESLGARLARDGPLPAAEVIRLLTPLARALAFAHREGVVHRDIKPDNILLAQGEPVLADFGIAKVLRDGAAHGSLTSAGMSIGTVTYMAPEQVLADPSIDGRADVYSLAAVGYELLSGSAPFTGSPQQVMSAHVVKTPPPLAETAPATPAALQDVIARGMAKEMADRPTADEFAVMLLDAASAASNTMRAAAHVSATHSATATASGGGRTRLVASIGIMVALAAGATWWIAGRDGRASMTGAVTNERPGLAVLPFERIGGPDDAYIAAGLTDELMSQLAEIPELRVAARTSVRAYADSALPPSELGQRLDVRALVEGSVQRIGEQLRVSTRLVDVRDGSTLWSERYERNVRDLFTVQREIGGAVVAALGPRLGLSGQRGRSEAGTKDAQAYDLFLRARYALDQRGLDSLRTAIALFTQATERDPQFARAFAGVAEATALLPQYGGGSYAEHETSIRASAARALSIDSALAAPHMALGLLAKGTGAWRVAEQEFNLSLAQQGDFAPAHQSLGELLLTLGRVDDAIRALARAAAIEPANAPMVAEFAFALVVGGQVDSAQRVIDRALAQDSRNVFTLFTRAVILERLGDADGALSAMLQAVDRAPLPLFVGGTVRLARRANDSSAEQRARLQLASMGAVPGIALARVIADADSATPASMAAGMEQAIAERDPFIYQIPLRMWWFDRMRGSAGLARVAEKLGLPTTAVEAGTSSRE